MSDRISLGLPVGMGKPWSIADNSGRFSYVEISKPKGDKPVTFRAATQISLIETRVGSATLYPGSFKVVVPARALKSMRAVQAGAGYPRRYKITIDPSHEAGGYWIETSYGDGLRIRGNLSSEARAFPKNPALAIPEIEASGWDPETVPHRALEIPELQRMLGAMPTALRRTKVYFRGGKSQPVVARSADGINLESTIVLLPTIWESA